ncbi:hypothetical protein VTL71DRAFT_9181 [Oculimacula yallundae]|uniref:Uncharacterized protein n=1 Tax=Oculimacula yallundae TaxID=86028 RepID=A0ABR4BSF9_9HELO
MTATRDKLGDEILHKFVIPIMFHFIDTDDFVTDGLDLSTLDFRTTFYKSTIDRWLMLVAWMFEELIGDLVDFESKKCQALLHKRFMLYIGPAMRTCVAYNIADKAQGFFIHKADFFREVITQNRVAGMMAVLPVARDLPLPIIWTSNRYRPWSKSSIDLMTCEAARNAEWTADEEKETQATIASIYGGSPSPRPAQVPRPSLHDSSSTLRRGRGRLRDSGTSRGKPRSANKRGHPNAAITQTPSKRVGNPKHEMFRRVDGSERID